MFTRTSRISVSTTLPICALTLLTLQPSPARAENCALMLQPIFQFIKQHPGGNVPAAVYATATKQFASRSMDRTVDHVRISNGIMKQGVLLWGSPFSQQIDSLSADINTVQNTNNFVAGTQKLRLKINMLGGVSVQELIKTSSGQFVPIGNMPPTVFQASCSIGLLTAVVSNTWTGSWTVSLTATPP